jgi:hypothetical protein
MKFLSFYRAYRIPKIPAEIRSVKNAGIELILSTMSNYSSKLKSVVH